MTKQPTEVAILGGTGFIGQRLTDWLRGSEIDGANARGRHVVSFSSQACNLLDLEQAGQSLAVVNEATVLVICAGISRLAGDSWSLFQTNLTMIRNFMQAIEPVRPRGIVFLSSTDIYGLPAVELPISESTLPRPTTYYGLSKQACERMFSLARPAAYPVACLRLPGIYGPTDGGRSVVGTFCRRLAARQPIQLSGDGRVARDFVHVDDLCALIEALIAEPVDVTLNVATGESVAIGDIATHVGQQLQLPPSELAALIEAIPATADRDHNLAFDTRRLRQRFPDIPFRSVRTGIADYLSHGEEAD